MGGESDRHPSLRLRAAQRRDAVLFGRHAPSFEVERRDPERRWWIAEDEGRALGWLRIEREGREARLEIHFRDARGGGKAPEVVQRAVERALDRLKLEWAPERVRARSADGGPDWRASLEACGFEAEEPGARHFVRKLPPPTGEEIQRHKAGAWTDPRVAERYEKRVHRRRGAVPVKNRVELATVLRHAHGRVLDAGAGTGRFALALARAGRDVIALDTSAAMLRVAIAKARGTLPALVGDVLRVPFADESFDAVVSVTVLEHLPLHREAVAELARVLRPAGTFVFQLRSAEHARRAALPRLARPADFVVQLGGDEIRALVGEAGLETVRIAPYGLFNGNQILERRLGRGARWLERGVGALLAIPGMARLLAAFEIAVLGRAPLWVCNGVLIVARKPSRGA